MHQVDTQLMSADPVQRLHLTQERIDLHAEHLRLVTSTADLAELERAFVRVARSYGERYDITYSAWRQVGVDAEVLAKAGIKPKAPRVAPGKAVVAPMEPATEPTLFAESAKKAPAKKVAAKKATAAAKKNGAKPAVKKSVATATE